MTDTQVNSLDAGRSSARQSAGHNWRSLLGGLVAIAVLLATIYFGSFYWVVLRHVSTFSIDASGTKCKHFFTANETLVIQVYWPAIRLYDVTTNSQIDVNLEVQYIDE